MDLILNNFAVNDRLDTNGRWNSLWRERLAYPPISLFQRLRHSRETSLRGYRHAAKGKEIFP